MGTTTAMAQLTNCNCINEETEACAQSEHNKCDETTISHMCMCFCHFNSVGDRFLNKGITWLKTGSKSHVRV